MNRRNFLKSLSRTALVLPFSEVLRMAAPPWRRAYAAEQNQTGMTRSYEATPVAPPPGPLSPIAGTPLGISFVDVANTAGLNAKTIYGGIGSNKYLLETTGCGAAFRALALGAGAVGALAIGALAVGSAAIGALAIGALTIRRLRLLEAARLKELHIDRLTIGELEIQSTIPPKTE
jgi:hypothetical protein